MGRYPAPPQVISRSSNLGLKRHEVYLSSNDGTELVAGYGTTGHDASETAATGSEFSAQWLIQNRFLDSRRCSA